MDDDHQTRIVLLLNDIRTLILKESENECYLSTVMVTSILPKISRLFRELKINVDTIGNGLVVINKVGSSHCQVFCPSDTKCSSNYVEDYNGLAIFPKDSVLTFNAQVKIENGVVNTKPTYFQSFISRIKSWLV